MGSVSGPDAVFWRWLELQQRLRSTGGSHRIVDQGLIFGPRCLNCRGEEMDERSSGAGSAAWFCAGCGSPWPIDIGHLLSHELRHSRRPGQSDLREAAADLSIALASLVQREQRAYLLLYLYENVGSYDVVAREMSKRFPRSKPPGNGGQWTEWSARRVISTARSKIVQSMAGQKNMPPLFGQRLNAGQSSAHASSKGAAVPKPRTRRAKS